MLYIFYLERVSWSCPGKIETCDTLASAFQPLGLQVCITVPRYLIELLKQSCKRGTVFLTKHIHDVDTVYTKGVWKSSLKILGRY